MQSRTFFLSFLFLPLLSFSAFALALHIQDADQTYIEQLNRISGNKIVLLGDWKKEDISKWDNIINSNDLVGYDLKILGRSNFQWMAAFDFRANKPNPNKEAELRGFEAWVRRQSGSPATRWAVFDNSNRVIAAGVNVPEIQAFDSAMENAGIISQLRQLRAFLKEHPSHLDARADLLKEARRRALLAAPKDMSGDLKEAEDLRTWGVLAREFDLAMAQAWIGYKLEFFKPEEDQPEKYSPLMKATFRKHIGRVEDALRELPSNQNLWDIWAWMAKGLGDRSVFKFINSLDSYAPNHPSPKVAAWLTALAKTNEDWENVIQLARLGRNYHSHVLETKVAWTPNRFFTATIRKGIPGYPEKSSYYPWLEALLKLGRIEDANEVFDTMIRAHGAGNARDAADIARICGVEELAEIWSKGAVTKQIPFCEPIEWGKPQVVVASSWDKPEYQQIKSMLDDLKLRWRIYETWPHWNRTLNWTGDDFRYALIDGDGLVMKEGTETLDSDELQEILEKNGIKTTAELAMEFLKDSPNHPETLITLGIDDILNAIGILEARSNDSDLDSTLDDEVWGRAAFAWNKIFNHEYAIYAIPYFYAKKIATHSPLMKSISRRFRPNIEKALLAVPNSEAMWNLCLFWRNVAGNEWDFEPLLEKITPSPMDVKGTCPPPIFLEIYYNECKEKNDWSKIIKLLTEVWDRETSLQIQENKTSEKNNEQPKLIYSQLGDNVGYPLIEALLNSGRTRDADDVFIAWLDCGGTFSNISVLTELARKLGYESLAREWETRLKKP
jgi:pentatricopeptide repeat protein